ncbi:MAG: hypothetical protein HY326_05460 [Chloroflexi bacterium]|nr:hypothetical protein [Chloroflexota bacterium]
MDKWARPAGLSLALLWAGFWIYFGLASGSYEGADTTGLLIHMAVPGLIFLLFALIPWHWERPGGALLAMVGFMVLVIYPMVTAYVFPSSTVGAVIVTMALPPVVAGWLLLAHARRIEY